jgi:hypothetical protein
LFEVLLVNKIVVVVDEYVLGASDEGPRATDKAVGATVAITAVEKKNPHQVLKG